MLTAAAVRLTPPVAVGHDPAWYLHAADRLLAGGRLYVDVVDVNPPLVLDLHEAVAGLAHRLGIGDAVALHGTLLVLALTALTIAVVPAARLLRLARQPAAALLVAGWAWVLLWLPGSDFAQREHVALAGLLPFAVVVATRTAGAKPSRPSAVAAGVLAGLAVALKPPLALAVIGAWIGAGRRRAWATPEGVAAAMVLGGYGVRILLLPHDERAGLLDTLGLAWRTYGALGLPWSGVTTPLGLEAIVLGGVLLLRPRRGPASALIGALGGAWLGALAAALLQQKGWSYHFLPARGLGWAALLALAARALRDRPRLTWAAILVALPMVAAGTVQHGPDGLELAGRDHDQHAAATELAAAAGGGRVLVLDTDLFPHYPRLLYAGLRTTSRYACLWWLPGALANDDPPQDRRRREELLADLARRPPALVLLRRPPTPHVADPAFDVGRWLRRDPRLARWLDGLAPIGERDGVLWLRPR